MFIAKRNNRMLPLVIFPESRIIGNNIPKKRNSLKFIPRNYDSSNAMHVRWTDGLLRSIFTAGREKNCC
jgi:hypothetical protein